MAGGSGRALRRRLTAALVALAGASGCLLAGMRLEALEERRAAERARASLLYLPSGRYLVVASLGYRHLLADLIYLWSIQYYGNYDIENRYEYLDRVYREVITELDPNYIDPYWIGALIMSVERGDLEGALRLLEKGMAANPDEWILPYLAGWECYHLQRFDRAAEYFERAGAIPGAPPVIRRAYAAMFQKQGDLRSALEAWREILEDPGMDELGREVAARKVRSLQADVDLADLNAAIALYRERHGAPPPRLQALVADGLIGRVPVDPEGRPYRYDRAEGQARPPSAQVLGRR